MARKKPGPIASLYLETLEPKGRAVGRQDGKVVFVEGGAPEETVSVRVIKKRRGYLEGSIDAVLEASPFRQEPFCQHFSNCGGCKWQHVVYPEQARQKQQLVKDQFMKIAHLREVLIKDAVESELSTFYRNKLEFTFSTSRWLDAKEVDQDEVKDRRALGFHVLGRFDRVEHVEHCWLEADPANAIRNYCYQLAIELDIPFYDIRSHEGHLRTLMIRITEAGEIMVVLQAAEFTPQVKILLDHVREEFPQITSLLYVINTKKNDTMYDQEVLLHSGRNFIIEELFDLKFKIQAKSFFQTNTRQTKILYSIALSYADLSGSELVYDLYTGTGSIALCAAKKAKKVVGIEYVQDAIDDAYSNMELNSIRNTSFFAGDLKEVLTQDFVEEHGKPDVIITDPPRAGMHQDVVKRMLEITSKRIVYISCNPATQARDIELLSEKYEVIEVTPVDMFPHTPHIESVALLQLKM